MTTKLNAINLNNNNTTRKPRDAAFSVVFETEDKSEESSAKNSAIGTPGKRSS